MYVVIPVAFFAARDILRLVNIEGTVIFEHLLYQSLTFEVEIIVLSVPLEEVRNEGADGRESLFCLIDKSLMKNEAILNL
jgi:hypothetical protein